MGQFIAFVIGVNIGLTFGPPFLVIYFTFQWAQRQRWTNLPNLNGMILAVGIICVWIPLCIVVGQDMKYENYGNMAMFASFADRGSAWIPFWLGALRVGFYSIIVALAAAGIFLIYLVGRWLLDPRRRY